MAYRGPYPEPLAGHEAGWRDALRIHGPDFPIGNRTLGEVFLEEINEARARLGLALRTE